MWLLIILLLLLSLHASTKNNNINNNNTYNVRKRLIFQHWFHARVCCTYGECLVSVAGKFHRDRHGKRCSVVHTPTVSLIFLYNCLFIIIYFFSTAAAIREDRKNGLDFEKSLIYTPNRYIIIIICWRCTWRNE